MPEINVHSFIVRLVLCICGKIWQRCATWASRLRTAVEIIQLCLLCGSDSRYLGSANEVDFLPAAGRLQQQQQHRLLNIIERLLSHNDNDNDHYDEWLNDAVMTVPEQQQQLAPGWRQLVVDDRSGVSKRYWLRRNRSRTLKRGPGSCINSCLTGGMSFVRCKSMCHW